MAMQGDEASIERGYRRLSSLFLRPGIDQQKCQRCKSTVYQQERLGPVHDVVFHKTCFKCVTCGQFLTLKNYWSNQVDADDREIYCNSHVPRIGGAKIDKEALGIKSAMSVQQHFKRNADSKTSEKRIPDNIPQVGADALMIQRALKAPKTSQYGQEGNVPATSLDINAWGIKDAMDAQVLQKRYQRKLDKHHFPPHIVSFACQSLNITLKLKPISLFTANGNYQFLHDNVILTLPALGIFAKFTSPFFPLDRRPNERRNVYLTRKILERNSFS